MTLIRADGFDHWGTRANMLLAGYQEFNSTINPTTNNVRTGNYASYVGTSGAGRGIVGIPLGVSRATMGFEIGFYCATLPTTLSWGCGLGDGTTGLQTNQIVWVVDTSGHLQLWAFFVDGNGAFLGTTPNQEVFPGTYTCVAIKAFSGLLNGVVELRVNGVQKLLLTNVNTNPNGTGIYNIAQWGRLRSGDDLVHAFDDMVVWDTLGTVDNDFICTPSSSGPRCRTIFTSSPGTNQDWTPNNAPAYAEINRVPPVPATHFISASTIGDVSDFGMDHVPSNTSYCAGIAMYSLLDKSDAGACVITPGISSNGTVAPGDPVAPILGGAYALDIFEVDPDTGIYFTVSGINNVLASVDRTA